MKATEVLKRYADGRRDFSGENLRGQSFKGKNLSGANFSDADVRGANFTNAILRGANFTRARAGLQKRWIVGQLIVSLVLAEAGQNPKNEATQKQAKKAIGFLKVIAEGLPSAASLVKTCQDLLPAIAHYFGL